MPFTDLGFFMGAPAFCRGTRAPEHFNFQRKELTMHRLKTALLITAVALPGWTALRAAQWSDYKYAPYPPDQRERMNERIDAQDKGASNSSDDVADWWQDYQADQNLNPISPKRERPAYPNHYETHYGPHYTWDPQAQQWKRDYGYYDSYFDVTPRDETGTGPASPNHFTRQQVVTGTVESFHRVPFNQRQGEQGKHTLVRIRLEDGRSTLVDLGPRWDLQDLELKQGNHVRMTGEMGTIDGHWALLADQIQAHGQTWNVFRGQDSRQVRSASASNRESNNTGETQGQDRFATRAQPSLNGNTGNASQLPGGEHLHPRTYTYRGTVEDFHRVQLAGQPSQDLLIKIRLENGRSVIADLGPEVSMADLSLHPNDHIVMRGEMDQMNGKSVLRAEHITIEGRNNMRIIEPNHTGQTGYR